MKINALLPILFALWLTTFLFPIHGEAFNYLPPESTPLSFAAHTDESAQGGAQNGSSESSAVEESMEESEQTIPDPFEPINRVFFKVNDKIYFWVLKPLAKGYMVVIPENARISVSNFVSNVTTPIRFANCLLQLNIKGAGKELVRLMLNSTFGVGGLFDVAKDEFNITKQNEDFGQTLGFWGLKPFFFIEWPIYGPSSLRDTIGMAGDAYLDPHSYLLTSYGSYFGVTAFEMVNQTSLAMEEYDDLKKAALDPYVAVRDAYFQYRENKIKQR